MARGALGGWVLDDEGEGPSEVTRLSPSCTKEVSNDVDATAAEDKSLPFLKRTTPLVNAARGRLTLRAPSFAYQNHGFVRDPPCQEASYHDHPDARPCGSYVSNYVQATIGRLNPSRITTFKSCDHLPHLL